MENYVKTNAPGFYRDLNTNAVINMNDAEYQQILIARRKNKEISTIHSEVSVLKQEMSEIKNLLMVLINGKDNG
jgi:hypothetical protein